MSCRIWVTPSKEGAIWVLMLILQGENEIEESTDKITTEGQELRFEDLPFVDLPISLDQAIDEICLQDL